MSQGSDIAVIKNDIKNIYIKVSDLANHVKGQNGRVGKNEVSIGRLQELIHDLIKDTKTARDTARSWVQWIPGIVLGLVAVLISLRAGG